MTATTSRIALLALVLALSAAGCGDANRPLARVGDRTITAGEFRREAALNLDHYPGTPEESKRTLFDDLLEQLSVRAVHDDSSTGCCEPERESLAEAT
mgnify:CR=1 FL=1